MSSDIDLPFTLRHDQVSANAAHPAVPGNVYSHVHVAAGGRSHLGNSYNFGPTEDHQILQSILQSLHYPEMGQRGRDVPDAGADTFEWLFEDCDSQASQKSSESDEYEQDYVDDAGQSDDEEHNDHEEREDESEAASGDESDAGSSYSLDRYERDDIATKLRSWLKDDGDSVFWVTGKPGSGKSTFMKFLRDQEGTHALLQEWAQDALLIVADHFFWLPGTQLQNNFEGFARSLMHAILSSLAADIPAAKTICGKRRWSLTASHRPWSQSEFKQMFCNLGRLRGVRVFILIDGLDECCPQHAHDDFMDTLMNIIQRPNFKTCLSSRPWEEFAARLDRSPSLCLEGITRLDMFAYVSKRFHHAAQGRDMTAAAARRLVYLVVDRADGVFLWVELVVRAVNVELKKGRGLSRLSSIVQDFPSELDDYFTVLIYDRIEKTTGNISDTASVLNLAIQLEEFDRSRREDSRIPYGSVRRGFDTTSLLKLALQRRFRHPHLSSTVLEGHAFLDFWLLSRGALDHPIKYPNTSVPTYDQEAVAVMQAQTRTFLELASKDLLVLRGSNVEVLHRTVHDYLKQGWVNEAIRKLSPPHFQKPGFMLDVQTLRCVHSLMMSDVTCQAVDDALQVIARHPCLAMATGTNFSSFTTACESLAINHLHNTCSCLGVGGGRSAGPFVHSVRSLPRAPTKPHLFPMPYRYVRALYRHWPHIAHTWLTRQYLSDSLFKSRHIRQMRLRDLCSACTEIMHDCLYSGVIPDRWIAPKKSLPRKRFDPKKIFKPLVQSDDGLPRALCEFCGVHLSSSRDCGLQDAFFLFEKIAFERLRPEVGNLAHTQSGSPSSEHQIVKILPFELPWSTLRRTDGLRKMRASPRFRKFVWCRQKLRAVGSLLKTLRRQLPVLASVDVDDDSTSLLSVQITWRKFIQSFAGIPLWQDGRGSEYQCQYCSTFIFSSIVVVTLRSDEFSTSCEACHRKSTSPTEPEPPYTFTIEDQFLASISLRFSPNRSLMGAMVQIIAWYSDTAPAFGLGYLVPSDTAEIQRKLLLVPESHV